MLCTRMAWSCLGALAVATWLATAPAQAQDNYHMVTTGNTGENGEELTELRSEISELRSNMKATVSSGYEQGPSCGCGAHAAPTCGCEAEVGCGCGECCCHNSGFWASGELLWFRYHRADGVRVGQAPTEQAEFDFEITPRVTLGWVREDGLGVRARYWEFDHNGAAVGPGELRSAVEVDTWTLDGEVFETFCLNNCWDLELSAGVRYCEFFEQLHDEVTTPATDEFRTNRFTGWGGLLGAEVRRKIGTSGLLWARARAAILMSDKDVFNNDGGTPVSRRLPDVVVGMTELAFGYDYTVPLCDGSYCFAGVTAEWQNWYNFSSSFDYTGSEDFAGPSDVGFGGFGLRAGICR